MRVRASGFGNTGGKSVQGCVVSLFTACMHPHALSSFRSREHGISS